MISIHGLRSVYTFLDTMINGNVIASFVQKKSKSFEILWSKKIYFAYVRNLETPSHPPLYVIVRIWLDSSPLPLCVRTMWMTPIGIIKKNTITQLIHLLKPPQLVQSF